jgi:hypothetical protein
LRNVGLLKFYEEATSLKGNSSFLYQLICRWDHARQTFRASHDLWYYPIEEDIYFIGGLFRRRCWKCGKDRNYKRDCKLKVGERIYASGGN